MARIKQIEGRTLKMDSYIIEGVRYPIGEKYLLCTVIISRAGLAFDVKAKVKRLYYPRGKAFLLTTSNDFMGQIEAKLITEKQARRFMDEHPDILELLQNYKKCNRSKDEPRGNAENYSKKCKKSRHDLMKKTWRFSY